MGTELVVPTSRQAVLALDSPTLYLLEQAGEIAREILDGRIIEWTEQGWSQRKIAGEVGCSQSSVSRRQARLGVQPSQPHTSVESDAGCITSNGEVVDAEVMPEQLDFVCEQEWTDEERELRAEIEEGLTVVINLGRHRDLVAWAQAEGLLAKIDRTTIWGNPFKIGEPPEGDGDRQTVIAAYHNHYLPHRPSLLARLDELQGKALGCWCAPEPCHGDGLREALEDG
jgi:hypothetical protein